MGKADTFHGTKVTYIAWRCNPENDMLLSGGHDGSIRLFHAPSRSCLMSFDACGQWLV